MIGSTDGGKHIEGMRTGRMKNGNCSLCGKYSAPLERHHEKYKPERCIYLCHHCHHRAHFRPYHLTDREKDKLLAVRYGASQWIAIRRKKNLYQRVMANYVAPGRRAAQNAVRAMLQDMRKDAIRAKRKPRKPRPR